MSKESANSFVEKVLTDKNFVNELFIHDGISKNAVEPEKTEILLKAAKEMGYDFTIEEYKEASKKFFEGKDAEATLDILTNLYEAIENTHK